MATSKWLKEQVHTCVINFANPEESWLEGRRYKTIDEDRCVVFHGSYKQEIYCLLYYIEDLGCKLEPDDQKMIFQTLENCILEATKRWPPFRAIARTVLGSMAIYDESEGPTVVRARGAIKILLAYAKNHRVCDEGLCDEVKKGLKKLGRRGILDIGDFAPYM